jgi:hypothetical protein
LNEQREDAPQCHIQKQSRPDCRVGPPVLSGLDNGEEHHVLMIEHSIVHSSIACMTIASA